MAALLGYAGQQGTPLEPVLVLADCDAPGLETARELGTDALALPRRNFPSKVEHEAAMVSAIGASGAELVCLAGFMRLLSSCFCRRYEGRLVNIHPSLLPRHKGLDTHRRALEAGDSEHGCSVHFVTPGMDEGPVIAQARVPVLAGDTRDSLAARVLAEEHKLYPMAVGAIAGNLVELRDGKVENRPGTLPGSLEGMGQPLRWPFLQQTG